VDGCALGGLGIWGPAHHEAAGGRGKHSGLKWRHPLKESSSPEEPTERGSEI